MVLARFWLLLPRGKSNRRASGGAEPPGFHNETIPPPREARQKRGINMSSNRIGRINEEIQRELASLLRTVKDPRLQGGLVTITHVDTTSDLRYAKIYISSLNKENEKEMMKGLRSASGYLRRELGAALRLRYTPELQFIADDSIQQGAHILEMLRDPNVVKPANPANGHIVLEDEK